MRYIPLLKAKKGEFTALEKLADRVRQQISPLIDISQHDKHSMDVHLDKVVENILSTWGDKYDFFADFFHVDLGVRTPSGIHFVKHFHEAARTKGLRPIPVVGFERDQEYIDAALDAVRLDDRGVCLRLLYDDLVLPDTLNDQLGEFIDEFSILRSNIDLMFDMRSLRNRDLDELLEVIRDAASHISNLADYRSFSLAGSNMPQSVSTEVPADSMGFIDRTELSLWRSLRNGSSPLPIHPVFADYTTIHPDLLDIDPRVFANTMGPNIRYATGDRWCILRGVSFSKHPEKRAQYYGLAKKLITEPFYCGPTYSFGDEFLHRKAAREGGPGSPTNWVSVGVNHHITHVIDSL
jgi:hypothetical protein